MPRLSVTPKPLPPLEHLFPGCLLVAGDLSSALPLEHTRVRAELTGILAAVTVTQQFSNPFQETAELIYLFPLPHTAALVDFEVQLGSRVIKGELHELETARREYEEAVRQGRQAGLAEQRMEGLYSVSLANVRPGEAISAVFRYHERIKYDDGAYEFVFPMGLTPKYHSPEHPEEGDGVDAPIASAGEKIGDVEIEVIIASGMPFREPTSPTHTITVVETTTMFNAQRISLAAPGLPNHDFVLRLPVLLDQSVLQAWRAAGEGGDYFLAVLQPPELAAMENTVAQPRQFIFVLDRSGSMSGQPIAQARNALRSCLRTLNPQDEFAIQLFDNVVEWYQPRFSPVNQAEIDKADKFLTAVEGRGGTEIIAALQAAFSFGRPPEGRLRYIVFLTDGAVSATERALAEISRKLGKARLFTFGIGPSVNRPLLSRMASLGRGTSEFLQLDEDIEGAIIRFQDRLAFPVLTDFSLEAENATTWDVLPNPLPDAYIGQPVVVLGRIKQNDEAAPRLVLNGMQGARPVQMAFSLPASVENPAVRRAWAKARLESLQDRFAVEGESSDRLRNEIISLALDYGLASRYTAFIAMDRDSTVADGEPRRVRVSQPLPEGLDIEGFIGRRQSVQAISPTPAGAPTILSNMTIDAYSIHEENLSNLDLPAFMRKTPKHSLSNAPTSTPEDLLRRLARSQMLDGSWDNDVEHTACALLNFVRNGYTTRRGSFRVAVMRAVDWLNHQRSSGMAELARLVALAEEKFAAGDKSVEEAVHWALGELGAAANPDDQALLPRLLKHEAVVQAEKITTADELRLAALSGQQLPVDEKAGEWFKGDWSEVWQNLVEG